MGASGIEQAWRNFQRAGSCVSSTSAIKRCLSSLCSHGHDQSLHSSLNGRILFRTGNGDQCLRIFHSRPWLFTHLFDNPDLQTIVHDWFAIFAITIDHRDVLLCAMMSSGATCFLSLGAPTPSKAKTGCPDGQSGVPNPQLDIFTLQQESIVLLRRTKASPGSKRFQLTTLMWVMPLACSDMRLCQMARGWPTKCTTTEDLKGFPERIGPLRDRQASRGKWAAVCERER